MPDIRMSSMTGVPYGPTENRPASPSIGQTFYNGTLGVQEIYTSSGWLPATGANDFNVTLSGSITTATFSKEYFAGAYTIASALLDSSYDIYVYDTSGNQVGYTKSPSLNATGNFNKIVIIGGSTGDLLSFSYKTTFTATNTTSQTTAGAFLSSVTPTSLPSINDTATITGGNIANNVVLTILDSSLNEYYPKSLTVNSSSSITFTRPDNLPIGTYSLKAVNLNVVAPTGSNLHILSNSINSGTAPSWQTSPTLPSGTRLSAYSTTLVASDIENLDVDYSLLSGTLQSGLSLDSETGVISGTPTVAGNNTFTVRATDSGGNYVDRQFSLLVNGILSDSTGGLTVTSGGYKYHLFKNTGSDSFNCAGAGTVQILLVAGGGAGDNDHGGGGGAGGILYHSGRTVQLGTYSITVGSGGLGNSGVPANGGDSTFTDGASVLTAFGGGRGSTTNADSGGNGGSGGGGGGANSGVGTRAGGSSTQTSNNGGTGYGSSGGTGGGSAGEPGGGGGGAGQTGLNSNSSRAGNGGAGRNDWATWLSAVSSLVSGDTLTIYNTGYIAGGGGGGSTSGGDQVQASGGLGGGGRGDCNVSPGLPGVANTGGGGGSHGNGGATGADGGSGVVILRYAV